MSTKTDLLDVTARLFAEHGWRGTTTRRIAEAAGVNEVTLFRQFGSKDAILVEAVHREAMRDRPGDLPEKPTHLRSELTEWANAHHERLRERRAMIRTCMAEFEEHPELAPVAVEGAMSSMADAVRYLATARTAGLIGKDGSLEAATVMLMNAIFMDAITRDVIPGCPISELDAIHAFVDLTLRSLGASEVG